MPEPILLEVRERLQRYLLGVESLAEFQRWFAGVVWRLGETGGADETVRLIELRLAEYNRGHWSAPQLRSRLRTALERNTLSAAHAESADWRPAASSRSPFRVVPAGLASDD